MVGLQLPPVLQLGALDPLGGEHAAAAEAPLHRGHRHFGMVGEEGGEAFGVVGLAAVVDLLEEGGAELIDNRSQPEAQVQGQQRSQQHRQAADDHQIAPHHERQPGPLHLHGHPAAVIETGPVDLPEAGRGHGKIGEFGEQLLGRSAQFRLDQAQRHPMGKRRQVVLQPGELLKPFPLHQVGPGGKGLPHLDEAGAQGAEGGQDAAGQPLLHVGIGAARLGDEGDRQPAEAADHLGEPADPDPGAQDQPAQVGVGVVAGRIPGWIDGARERQRDGGLNGGRWGRVGDRWGGGGQRCGVRRRAGD